MTRAADALDACTTWRSYFAVSFEAATAIALAGIVAAGAVLVARFLRRERQERNP